MTDRLSTALLLSKMDHAKLSQKYGGSAALWKGAGAATLIGSDIAQGLTKKTNLDLELSAIENQRDELEARAATSVSLIKQQGKKVGAAQEAAYASSGVNLEGSAMNVLAETATKAMEAAKVRQSEFDFQLGQMDVAAAVNRVKAKGVMTETLLGAAQSGMTAYAASSGKVDKALRPTQKEALLFDEWDMMENPENFIDSTPIDDRIRRMA